jgi:alkanesulfonate monooxygenase SsuD/methylene tetrahydromethanopterin reductase-like flavin-dependent oxidoreductase (luciferase family)
VLPIYPAALAAKIIATLDGVSDGRVEIGIGVGGEHPPEFEACGVPLRERGRRTDEALTVMSALFTGEPVHFDGRYTTLRGQQLEPVPVQRPVPRSGSVAEVKPRSVEQADVVTGGCPISSPPIKCKAD